MAKKSVSGRRRFAGKSFVLTGKFDHPPADLTRLIQFEGGVVQKAVSAGLDFLLIGGRTPKTTPDEKAVAKLNAAEAAIEILHETSFLHKSLIRSARDVAACLRTADADVAVMWMRWTNMRRNLAGADLRRINVDSLGFGFNLAKANLSQATVRELSAFKLDHAKCDGLTADSVFAEEGASGASFRQARIGQLEIEKCPKADFTDAVLGAVECILGDMRGAVFVRAVLRGAVLEDVDARGANFSQADLSGARCGEGSFEKARFTQADLRKVDFESARLVGADLRQADLRGARLVDADLRGAKIGGADFTGAVLDGANLKGVDTKAATGL